MKFFIKNQLTVIILAFSFLILPSLKGTELNDLGQILMVGFNGKKVTPELLTHLKYLKPGFIILFRRNIESPQQLSDLIQTLRREIDPLLNSPLVFALDQEGGSVVRIPTKPRIPSPMAIAKTGNFDIVERYGTAIGRVLKQNGITLNLAPVLDLEIPSKSNFLGSRSFGESPVNVAKMGYLFSKGMASVGVIPTGKHFPGIGSIDGDPHSMTPVSSLTWSKDWERELLPFREFSRLSPSALMLSHVVYPKLDKQNLPASISPYIINKVLRGTLNYKGLVITDDLLMSGITSQRSISEAAIQSLESGADIVMLSWSQKDQIKVFQKIQQAEGNKSLSPGLLDEKIQRIKQIKDLVKLDPTEKSEKLGWNFPELQQLNQELLKSNLEIDQSKYQKITNKKHIYFLNLGSLWHKIFRKKKNHLKFTPLDSIEGYLKLSNSQKKESLLFLGVNSKYSRSILSKLKIMDRKSVVLIVTNDYEVISSEHYFSVFTPRWPFDGLEEAVLNYL